MIAPLTSRPTPHAAEPQTRKVDASPVGTPALDCDPRTGHPRRLSWRTRDGVTYMLDVSRHQPLFSLICSRGPTWDHFLAAYMALTLPGEAMTAALGRTPSGRHNPSLVSERCDYLASGLLEAYQCHFGIA